MGRIIIVSKLKGGSGATTLTREIAVAAATDGHRVALVDLDGQGTLSRWWNRRTRDLTNGEIVNPALLAVPVGQLLTALPQARERYDLVLIDVPPSTHAFVTEVMRVCDFALVPVRPSTDDLDAVVPVLKLLAEAALPYAFVLNQCPSRARLVHDSLALLAKRSTVAATIGFRTGFPTAAASGGAAVEIAAKSKSAAEVRQLWTFVREQVLPRSQSNAMPSSRHAAMQ